MEEIWAGIGWMQKEGTEGKKEQSRRHDYAIEWRAIGFKRIDSDSLIHYMVDNTIRGMKTGTDRLEQTPSSRFFSVPPAFLPLSVRDGANISCLSLSGLIKSLFPPFTSLSYIASSSTLSTATTTTSFYPHVERHAFSCSLAFIHGLHEGFEPTDDDVVVGRVSI